MHPDIKIEILTLGLSAAVSNHKSIWVVARRLHHRPARCLVTLWCLNEVLRTISSICSQVATNNFHDSGLAVLFFDVDDRVAPNRMCLGVHCVSPPPRFAVLLSNSILSLIATLLLSNPRAPAAKHRT